MPEKALATRHAGDYVARRGQDAKTERCHPVAGLLVQLLALERMITLDAHRGYDAAPWNDAHRDAHLDVHPEPDLDVHPEPDLDAHRGYDAGSLNAAHRGNADLPLNRRYLLDVPSRNSRPLTKPPRIE